MTIKIFSKVLRTDLCKQNSKNVVFEPGINKTRRGSKVWLGFDGAYLNIPRCFLSHPALLCHLPFLLRPALLNSVVPLPSLFVILGMHQFPSCAKQIHQ